MTAFSPDLRILRQMRAQPAPIRFRYTVVSDVIIAGVDDMLALLRVVLWIDALVFNFAHVSITYRCRGIWEYAVRRWFKGHPAIDRTVILKGQGDEFIHFLADLLVSVGIGVAIAEA
jgi:hypothetical protein